ncbi:MAG: GreA/GreB family elongation factor [Oscillospiraceae bacterium]|nr:GreA/GreB family elongation factor [Oscillospiraceae bacterium]
MHNELTQQDIRMMQQELDERRIHLRPKLLEEVKVARGFGDLSENFEYKAAKREKNRNESRIRYLERMIKTAVVVSDDSEEGKVGLFDRVTVWVEEDEEEQTYRIVTTVRQDVLDNRVSNQSPFGKAMLGKAVGERVYIPVNDGYGYYVVIRAIEKGQDDGSIPINEF